jgi:predicted DsbA family dithiol-disulfide isomerase
VLLANQDRLTPADLEQHAADIGLDVDRFREDLRRGRESDRVARDVESADASGVAGTPSFFINGRRHEGAYDLETLTAAVGAARKRTLALRDAA